MPVDAAKRALFQNRISQEASTAFASGRNFLLSAPTGAGKTNMFIDIADDVLKTLRKKEKVLVIVDRQELVLQNAARARANTKYKVSICLDGKMDQTGDIVFGCSDTISKNIAQLSDYRFVIVDEVHHAAEPTKIDDRAEEYAIILDEATKPKKSGKPTLILGASATPVRSDGKPLHRAFENAIVGFVSLQEAVNAGVIVTPRQIPPVNPILANGRRVKDVVQDFLDPQNPGTTIGGLNKALKNNRPDNYFDAAVTAHLRNTKDQTTPTFAYVSTINETKELIAAFADRGIKALPYHSSLSEKEIRENKAAFERRDVAVLASADMLTEGIDSPMVEAILNCKYTVTRNEQVQMNGRAARAYHNADKGDKKDFVVTDMGASTYMYGDMNAIRLVEAYGAGQRQSLGEKAFSPWIAVDSDAIGQTNVYATHDGKKTVFLARHEQTGDWHAFAKAEIMTGPKRNHRTEITRHPNPAGGHGHIKVNNAEGIEALGRALVRAAPNAYATLAFQPAGPSLEQIAKKSYENAQGAIKKFISPISNINQSIPFTTPKKVAGVER